MKGGINLLANILWPVADYISYGIVSVGVLNSNYELFTHLLQNFLPLLTICVCNQIFHDAESVFLTAKLVYAGLYLVKNELFEELVVAETLFLKKFLDNVCTLLVLQAS